MPGMKFFIPLEDETMDQLGELDRLIPYQTGIPLFSQVEIIPAGEAGINPNEVQVRRLPLCQARPPCRH